ncbi:MAG: sodium:glutamate symporter [Lachnospiraceae bacterium]|nr:sodium:glutamate symporter [Lachnospiraceae bacterium]
MHFMMAFGWASIMLCLGMLLRAKVPFLRNMLVPASVIAGILGIVFINVTGVFGVDVGTNVGMFTDIVNNLFTVSFISISLTSTPKEEGNSAKNTLKGAWGLGVVWCFLYALTPLVGASIVALLGKGVGMDSIYGMLIQFAFCQGPGQSASYGALFEQFGWENASMVAIAFSAVGFVAAFLVGIPMAKAGVKRSIAKHCGKIDDAILKGYLKKEEQTEVMVKDTTCNSNIETLAFHFAIIGLCYVLAAGIANLLSMIPGFLGTSMSGMMFMNGMYAAYIMKFLLKKLKLDFLLENTLQSKITGWTADYLVVCAFMAVSVGIIKDWIVPILVVCIVTTVITAIVCFYFGQRFGGSNDFERTLGLYGTCTGTVPSGIALVRIVDPNFQTSTAVELGACNLVMMLSTPIYIILLALAAGSIGMPIALGGLAVCCVVYLIILKVSKIWGKPTFSWKGN